jgi:hypothetical protein
MSSLINDLVTDYNKTKKEFTAKARDAMRGAFTEFFGANPDIDRIAWTQYTPYFNDGDECIFGLTDMFFTLVKDKTDLSDCSYEDDVEGAYGSSWWSGDGEDDPIAEQRAVFALFKKEITTLPDEIFKNAFGDHVKVIASREGFDVEEYEHD